MHFIASHNVRILMRDRVSLSANIYRPEGDGPFPTVLSRTCYTKTDVVHADRGKFWTANGYTYIIQDVRGRGDSDGAFYPFVNECQDGSDTLDWIASQPWSDGRVVMLGRSYVGWTQVYAACSGNRHLAALAPFMMPPDPDRNVPLNCGMIMPVSAIWMATMDGHLNQTLHGIDLERAVATRPIASFDKVLGRDLLPWRDWVSNAGRGPYWAELAYQSRLMTTPQPMLHLSGWYDDSLNGALENYTALSKREFDGLAPAQRLVIGPWLHTTAGQRKSGEIDYGPAAELDLDALQRDWFDDCLGRRAHESAPVRLFVMGRNSWIEEQEWPIARTEYVPYYLHSAGAANTREGDGILSTMPPSEEPSDHFLYDPDNPVPYSTTVNWRQVGGPDDFSDIERRPDILVYTSEVFDAPIVICGPLRVRLFASTSARDTDWTAKILDVHPDGRAIRLNDGAVRARFREGHDREIFVQPGSIQEYDIDCWATCVELQSGHRLRLEISSSAFGKYDVNLNGGGRIGFETQAIIAQQTIYHDARRPSHVVLPILRG